MELVHRLMTDKTDFCMRWESFFDNPWSVSVNCPVRMNRVGERGDTQGH